MNLLMDDLRKVNEVDFIDWENLRNCRLFITGATGLVGTAVINALDYINKERELGIRIIALVRSVNRAEERFENIDADMLQLVEGSIEKLPKVEEHIDYIIHGASQTASREFVEHAVETIDTAILGTKNILEFAKEKDVKSFIYLSSMEVYGFPEKGHTVKEDEIGAFSPLNLRNSYPISKIMCEAMCCAYESEYDVPCKVVRLTQTFGPGVNYNDNRIFAYFGKCVQEKKNIVLKTAGESERCYLYTSDAVTAILSIMLKGENGKAYNAADDTTYCSIAEMAERIAKENGIEVEYDIQPAIENGFPDTAYMKLDTTKLKQLGWKPIVR